MGKLTDSITLIVIILLVTLTVVLMYKEAKVMTERRLELKKEKCLGGNSEACDYYFLNTGIKIKPLP